MRESLTIVLSGEAGQGLQTIEDFLVAAIKNDYHVFSNKEVMSRVRGGNNTVEIVIANESVNAYRQHIDVLFLLNNHSMNRLYKRVNDKTIIIGEENYLAEKEKSNYQFKPFNLNDLTKKAGHQLYANTILFGYIAHMILLDKKLCLSIIENRFAHLKEDVILKNKEAFNLGYDSYQKISLPKKIEKCQNKEKVRMIDGTSAISIGALAGGCNFVASYPMSPSTGVLIYLSKKAVEFDVLVEQAEDEIAALNMVVASWYAGARGLATTSGGGFALMGEALSLAGITETPCVVHIAQRPGPATGLPTRTEQGDLNLAIYSGHGDFPRIVLSPGSLMDACLLGQKAFYLADKYQVPVILLTDQYFLEAQGEIGEFTFDEKYLEQFVVKTKKDYLRYKISDSPISKRGIPGYGEGLVKADSDEHTEDGLITEDFDVRVVMQDKRMAKTKLILEDYQSCELLGDKEYEYLLVGFGSTYGVLKEFVETNKFKCAFLSIKQLYPLPISLLPFFNKAKKVICIENNTTGQLASLLKAELDVVTDHKILKYNGEPFSIEEIEEKIGEVIK